MLHNCLTFSNATARSHRTSKCHIAPLCDRCSSADADAGHDPAECAWLIGARLPANLLLDHFDLVTPLRFVWLASDAQRCVQFDAARQMQSHCTERRFQHIWQLHARQVVAPMLALCAHLLQPEQRCEAFVQRLCGILDVNTFEVRTERAAEIPVRGLYPLAAMLPHDCVSNTFIAVDARRVLRVYASVPIARGETVFNNYTSALLVSMDARLGVVGHNFIEMVIM